MRLVACVLASIAVLAVSGCSGSVTGEVSSKSEQKPVPAATVSVGEQTVVTDTSGRFTIDKVDTGEQQVSVAAAGYGPQTQTLDVQKGDNTLNVALEDGTVVGVLRENAEVKEPVKKAKVTVAGTQAKVEGSRFVIDSVPVGQQVVEVTAPDHEKYKETFEVAPGENEVKLSLNITPVESYARYHEAYRFERYREAYRLLHPDVQKHDGFKKFAKKMKAGPPAVDIKFFDPRMMKKWRCAWAKKTYKNVAALDRTIRYQGAYGDFSVNDTRHWQQIDGRWYLIYDWRDD